MNKFFKETADKTLHYLFAICHIQAVKIKKSTDTLVYSKYYRYI